MLIDHLIMMGEHLTYESAKMTDITSDGQQIKQQINPAVILKH